MNGNNALIHKFTNMDKYYFYDVNKHKIVNVSDEVYNLLLKENLDLDDLRHPTIEKLLEDGFLSSNRAEEMVHPASDMLDDFLDNKLKKMNLQLTQQCNFRCDYCVYSGGYENRSHTNKKMDWNTAKKGIDFLISKSKDSSSINVSFYGGEPLLEFELIKQCMEYATKAAEGKSVTFNMTTNGSLLSEDMVNIFLKYNINIAISLHGPRDIHNKNRKFAANGCGTFDTVYNNVKVFGEKYPEFKKRLQFSMVIDPSIELNCLNEFVATEEEFFNETTIMGSIIADNYRKDDVKISESFIERWQYNKFKYFLFLFGKIPDRNNSHLMRSSNSTLLDFITESSKSYYPLGKVSHHTGPCIPGQIRLFMNTEGEFFPCERVNEKSKVMNIGNINEGFYIEKVRNLLNVGKLTDKECKNCFAIRGCTVCAAMADDGNELSKELKLSACKNTRRTFEEMLKDACTLKELGFRSDMIKVTKKY